MVRCLKRTGLPYLAWPPLKDGSGMPGVTDPVLPASGRKVEPREAQAQIQRYSKEKHEEDGYRLEYQAKEG